jgi:competence protein ComEA
MIRSVVAKTLLALLTLIWIDRAVEAAATGKPALEGVLNLNEATVDQLRLLPGIGPSKALRILEQRKKRQFRRIEDLVLVKGIGPATFRRLAPYLKVSGPTTLRRKS